jgi:hypothetical protein
LVTIHKFCKDANSARALHPCKTALLPLRAQTDTPAETGKNHLSGQWTGFRRRAARFFMARLLCSDAKKGFPDSVAKVNDLL